jgi:hypothetical protein
MTPFNKLLQMLNYYVKLKLNYLIFLVIDAVVVDGVFHVAVTKYVTS